MTKSNISTRQENCNINHSESMQAQAGSVVLILIADGVDMDSVVALRAVLRNAGVTTLLTSPLVKIYKSAQETPILIEKILPTDDLCEFDAVFIAGIKGVQRAVLNKNVMPFVRNCYKSGKVLAALDLDVPLILELLATDCDKKTAGFPDDFKSSRIIQYQGNGEQFFKSFLAAIFQNKASHSQSSPNH